MLAPRSNTPGISRSVVDLNALAAEIDQAHRNGEEAARRSLKCYKQAGDALLKAKAAVGHGKWLEWLAKNVKFSRQMAERYMILSEGWPKLLTVSNLTLTEALQFLADLDKPTEDAATTSADSATTADAPAGQSANCNKLEEDEKTASSGSTSTTPDTAAAGDESQASEHGEATTEQPGQGNGQASAGTVKAKRKRTPKPPPDAGDSWEPPTDDDEAKTDENVKKAAAAQRDELGYELPPRLRDVFADEIIPDAIVHLKLTLKQVRSNQLLYPYVPLGEFTGQTEALLAMLKNAMPYCVHQQCQGKGCERCRTSGYLTRWRSEELGKHAELEANS